MNSPKSKIDWPRVLLQACRRIEQAVTPPSLAALAGELGVSASELQRQFTRRLGVSPKAYSQALQLHRLAHESGRNANTLDTLYSAGFESATTAYARTVKTLGVPPGRLKKEFVIGWWLGLSDLGWMLMAATDKGICWLAFGAEPGAMLEELHAAFPKARYQNDEHRLQDWFDQVREFVLLPREALDLPIDIQGTAFQASVWKVLRKIPLGETVAYQEVARRLGQPKAVRAVAGACASNKLALIIPCHRVIGSDGKLAGYRWGIERKQELLRREQNRKTY
ncbi:MAG TPA: methylated-DNA--[protein]-cysteine S-methyltransferase [Gammaproteobacteria bacterium]|nr:methylated-DNA--[protein]-cysteine S-methyltransferase [Gammaproteobacteria bacterium]